MRAREPRPAIRLMAALVLAGAGTGCMTAGVIGKARGETWHRIRISKVDAAGVLGEEIYLKLLVDRDQEQGSHPLVLRVPLDQVDGTGVESSRTGCRLGGTSVRPPSVGYYADMTGLPEGARPLAVEYFEAATYNDFLDHLYGMPEGLHVLISWSDYSLTKSEPAPAPPGDGSLPKNARLILVNRLADHAPRQVQVQDFSETPKKHGAWYLLTPFTVVGDIVTSPFQLLGMLLIEC